MHIPVYIIIFHISSNYTIHKSSGNSLHRSYIYIVLNTSAFATLPPPPPARTCSKQGVNALKPPNYFTGKPNTMRQPKEKLTKNPNTCTIYTVSRQHRINNVTLMEPQRIQRWILVVGIQKWTPQPQLDQLPHRRFADFLLHHRQDQWRRLRFRRTH